MITNPDDTMPNMRDAMVTEIEREFGGRVITVPPVLTGTGWRATLSGVDEPESVTLRSGTEEYAVRMLMAKLVESRAS